MAETGPGGREVGRVSLRVLPDTSNFLPSLKKYAERVERTVAVRLGTSIDSTGLERDAARISERIERTVPTIKIPARPITDQFAKDLQTKVRAAAKAIQANIPLTADGERFRREIFLQVEALEAEIARLDLEVPLDVESAARAKADLRAKVAELQAFASLHAVEVPVTAGAGGANGLSSIGSGPAMAALAGIAALISGGIIASLPALISSLAAPIAVIALGFEGIKAAAKILIPAFQAMRQALSNEFVKDLSSAFATLADLLPKITPQMQAIAAALSGGFTEFVNALATPEGLADLQGILQGVADALAILAPTLGPMTALFLDMANIGMQAFVDMAPALAEAFTEVVAIFQSLNDSGILAKAVEGFAMIVAGAVLVAGFVAAALVVVSSAIGYFADFSQAAVDAVAKVVNTFSGLASGVGAGISAAVDTIRTMPGRVISALGDLSGLLKGAGAALIGGLVQGMLSMLGPIGSAAAAVAQLIKNHFPGSPVKEGPLTSWNNGGAGKRLGDLLADGLTASTSTVKAASADLAGAVKAPATITGASVAVPVRHAAGNDPYLLADVLEGAMRQTPLLVDTRDNARAVARHNNERSQL